MHFQIKNSGICRGGCKEKTKNFSSPLNISKRMKNKKKNPKITLTKSIKTLLSKITDEQLVMHERKISNEWTFDELEDWNKVPVLLPLNILKHQFTFLESKKRKLYISYQWVK